jgi:hypothetical protein
MKLDSFVFKRQSLFSVNKSLKLKSINCKKKVFKVKSIVWVLVLLFLSFSVNAQSNSIIENKPSETQEMTTSLLIELERKVELYINFLNSSNNQNLTVNQKESNVVKLEKQKEDIISFIAHSLEDRCTSENRLAEIVTIVKPFDSKLAAKFEILNRENQQNLR